MPPAPDQLSGRSGAGSASVVRRRCSKMDNSVPKFRWRQRAKHRECRAQPSLGISDQRLPRWLCPPAQVPLTTPYTDGYPVAQPLGPPLPPTVFKNSFSRITAVAKTVRSVRFAKAFEASTSRTAAGIVPGNLVEYRTGRIHTLASWWHSSTCCWCRQQYRRSPSRRRRRYKELDPQPLTPMP